MTIQDELRAAALKAGIVDVDALRMADTSKVTAGGVDAFIKTMKEAKPYLFKPEPPRDVRKLSEPEWQAALAKLHADGNAEIARQHLAADMAVIKRADDEIQRQEARDKEN